MGGNGIRRSDTCEDNIFASMQIYLTLRRRLTGDVLSGEVLSGEVLSGEELSGDEGELSGEEELSGDEGELSGVHLPIDG